MSESVSCLEQSRGHLGRRSLRNPGRQLRLHPQGLVDRCYPSPVLGREIIEPGAVYATANICGETVGRDERYARSTGNVVIGSLLLRLIAAIDFAAEKTLGIVFS